MIVKYGEPVIFSSTIKSCSNQFFASDRHLCSHSEWCETDLLENKHESPLFWFVLWICLTFNTSLKKQRLNSQDMPEGHPREIHYSTVVRFSLLGNRKVFQRTIHFPTFCPFWKLWFYIPLTHSNTVLYYTSFEKDIRIWRCACPH